MSAHALNDEGRPIILEDELESILHILLYIAIRFIRSNLNPGDVGQFLHYYFDSYTPSVTAYRCGSAKLDAMEHGVISLRRYNGDTDEGKLTLKFYWPMSTASASSSTPPESKSDPEASTSSQHIPPPSDQPSSSTSPLHSDVDISTPHPINFIFDELLSWFRAYYAEDKASKHSTTTDSSGSNKGFKFVLPAAFKKKLAASIVKTAPSTSEPSKEDEAKRVALRDKLRSHDAIIDLFGEGLERVNWPSNDRVKDMKPKDGHVVRKDQGPMSSVTTTSQKRSCEEGETTSRSTKRSKN